MKKSPSSLKEEKEILDSYNADVDNDENKDTSSTNAKPREKEEEDSKRKFHSLGKLIVLIIIMVRMQPTFIITYREIVLLFFLHFIVITSR